MDGEFKVRAVESDNKSQAEIEQELLDREEAKKKEEAPEKVVEDKKVEDPKVEDQKVESTVELNEDNVLSFIKKKFEKEDLEWENLLKTETVEKIVEKPVELSEDILAFKKYKEETGRGIEDYAKLNRDFKSMPEDSLIAEFMRDKNPHLDTDDISYKMRKEFGYDSDMDDEDDIRYKKIKKKEKLAEALNHFESQKEKYKAPTEQVKSSIPNEDKEAWEQWKQEQQKASEQQAEIQKRRSNFSDRTNKLFSDNFEGFEFQVGEDKNVKYKVSDIDNVKNNQMDAKNFISKHLDENGLLKDEAAYHKSIFTASNPDAIAKFFYDLGKSDAIETEAKDAKNIKMDPHKAPEVHSDGAFKVTALPTSHGSGLKVKTRAKK